MVHPDVEGAIDQSDGKDDDRHDGGGGHPYKFAVEPAYHIHRSTFCFCMPILYVNQRETIWSRKSLFFSPAIRIFP